MNMVASLPSPPAPHIGLGRSGEDAATAYLAAAGYRVLARNVRFGRDELDIVAEDLARHMIVFAEVKTRSARSAAYPIRTAVTTRKRRALRRAVDAWITREDYRGPARIDVLCVHHGRVSEHLMDLGSDFF